MAIPQLANLLRLLPTEMIDVVLGMLDRKYMFILRLTCKALCSHATPMAFEKLHVWLDQDSLQRLVNIARHPQLCTHVHHISFVTDRFYNVDFSHFENELYCESAWNERTSCGDDLPETHKEEAWSLYRRYFERQWTYEYFDTDVTMMTEALEAFISLNKIALSDSQPWSSAPGRGPWGIKREGLILDDMLAVPEQAFNDLPRGGRQLHVLLRALAGRTSNLQELSVHLFASNISEGGFYSPLTVDDVSLAIPAFGGLKRLYLRLQIVQPSVMKQWRQPSQESPLTTILRAATGLENLGLELPNDEWGGGFWPEGAGRCWRDLIQLHCFGQLKELTIDGGILDEADFVAFLLQSCQRLKTLTLSWASVIKGPWSHRSLVERANMVNATDTRGDWDNIFGAIRSLPALEKIDLINLWQDLDRKGSRTMINWDKRDPEPMYEFLLGREEDNPWLGICQESIARGEAAGPGTP